MSRAKPASVRFYFDADVLGLAQVVAGLRSDATYPGDPGAIIKRRERPPCPIADPATKDDVWIPRVASLGWLIFTRDSRIQQHRAEIAAVKGSNARMVALAGDEACGNWQQLEILLRQWRAVEDLAARPGPVHLHRHTLVLQSRRSALTDENGTYAWFIKDASRSAAAARDVCRWCMSARPVLATAAAKSGSSIALTTPTR